MSTYEGKYELLPEYVITISSENDKLFVVAYEVPKTCLFQISPTEFIIPAMKAKLTFASDNAGEVNQLNIILNGQPMTAKRVRTFDATTGNPDDYIGNFFSPELGRIEFTQDDKNAFTGCVSSERRISNIKFVKID